MNVCAESLCLRACCADVVTMKRCLLVLSVKHIHDRAQALTNSVPRKHGMPLSQEVLYLLAVLL